jgi:hypothetical protein
MMKNLQQNPEKALKDAVFRAMSQERNAGAAVEEICAQLPADVESVLFFASPDYPPDELAAAWKGSLDCPIFGATTAGEIHSPDGYLRRSLVAVGFRSEDFRLQPILIPSLSAFLQKPEDLALSFPALPGETTPARGFPLPDAPLYVGETNRSGESGNLVFCLLDGLSGLEESIVSTLHQRLPGIPLVGGSAGDALRFRRTLVYAGGTFHTGAGVLGMIRTRLPYRLFRAQHFVPTDTRMVITEASPEARKVHEINGIPAAEAYASLVGREVEDLDPAIFASHPLMLRVGGEFFVRSIRQHEPDGSLTFFCAIDQGLVLTLAQQDDFLQNLQNELASLEKKPGNLQLILGFDCILRRLELTHSNEITRVKEILQNYPFTGMSTYGEQIGPLHINHTLTGWALGRLPA